MTVAAWLFTSFLVIVITLVVMGAALRPYVMALAADRDRMKLRAEAAEAELEASGGAHDVRIIPQIDPADELDTWLRGTERRNR